MSKRQTELRRKDMPDLDGIPMKVLDEVSDYNVEERVTFIQELDEMDLQEEALDLMQEKELLKASVRYLKERLQNAYK